MCSIWIVLSICARCPTTTLTLPFATHPTVMRKAEIFIWGGRFWERFDRYKKPQITPPHPISNNKPTGIHTQGGTWATKYRRPSITPTEADSTAIRFGQTDSKLQRIDWDVAPQQEFFDELFRVSKNQVIWGGNYFCLPPTRCFLVWRKLSISEKFSMAMCEYAWTSFNGNAKLFESVPQRGKYSGKFHPTEKPIALYNWILDLFAKDGDKIFDPMMGSQSSRCAAFLSGYDYCGCEIDEYYFNKGNEFFERICHGVEIDEKGNKIIQTKLFNV